MRAGRLRHTISIEKITETQNDYGEAVKAWSDHLADVRAAIEPINGREYFAQDSRHAEVTTRFRLRYAEGITNKMRIRFGTRYYNIVSVILPEERRCAELIIMAKEDVD